MSHMTGEVKAARSVLESIYEPVREELAEVEEVLRSELRSDDPFVDELAQHSFHLGGKRLRPALLLLAGKTVGELNRSHIVLAAVVEMIHTATLVHDDVLDEAQLRRYRETVNAQWNNEASVLLGDYLFTHAFYLASSLDSTMACRTIGRSTNIVCEGELRQIKSRGNFSLSEKEYLAIIEAKTAELCACCCGLGAHYAGASEVGQNALTAYGRYLGIAFQITDDLLDLFGDEQTTGKSLGTDLVKQKLTLPLIRLLSQVDDQRREALTALLAAPATNHRAELREWLEASGAMEYARQQAARYAQRAGEQLKDLPESAARQVLEQLPRFVVQRRQ